MSQAFYHIAIAESPVEVPRLAWLLLAATVAVAALSLTLIGSGSFGHLFPYITT